jgi:hypothetical protein
VCIPQKLQTETLLLQELRRTVGDEATRSTKDYVEDGVAFSTGGPAGPESTPKPLLTNAGQVTPQSGGPIKAFSPDRSTGQTLRHTMCHKYLPAQGCLLNVST